MNLYELYTTTGKRYFVAAYGVSVAIMRVMQVSGEDVSCWYIGTSLPEGATVL